MTITESVDPVTAGDAAGLTYTVHLENLGPATAAATEVEIAVVLPAGVSMGAPVASVGSYAGTTWTVGSLAADGVETLEIPLAVADTTVAGTDVISITATASTSTTDVDTDNNTATEATSVALAPTDPTDPATPTDPADPTTPSSPSTPDTPSTPGVTGAVRSAGETTKGQALPRTGSEVVDLALFGLVSILLGAAALWVTSRRGRYVGAHLR